MLIYSIIYPMSEISRCILKTHLIANKHLGGQKMLMGIHIILALTTIICVIVIEVLSFSKNRDSIGNMRKRKRLCLALCIMCGMAAIISSWQEYSKYLIGFLLILSVFWGFLFVALNNVLKKEERKERGRM